MYRINEDVAKSNKILNELGTLRIQKEELEKIKRVVEELKEFLVKNNSVGYLGPFTQLLYNMTKLMYLSTRDGWYERARYNQDRRIRKGVAGAMDFKVSEITLLSDFINVFRRIQENKDIIKNLRDRSGNLVKIEDLKTLHQLEDCLDDLTKWRKFNNFIKGFPKAQKDLIWENGYFKSEIKDIPALYQAVENIIKDSREDVFLKKVSNIKTTTDMVDKIINMGAKGIPWDIDDYLKEINKSKDVKIIYNKNNYLIIKIKSANEVQKYCGDTAWCIKSQSMFQSYYIKGDFFALLNFNVNSSDKLSKVGMTYRKGIMYDCQNKYDRPTDFRNLGLGDIRKILDGGKETQPEVSPLRVDQYANLVAKKGNIFTRIKNWLDYHYGDLEL